MKTMTCKQLGGACDQKFHASSFNEMSRMSQQHGIEMMKKGDEAHMRAMNEMREQMKSPESMKRWMENKKKEYDALPED